MITRRAVPLLTVPDLDAAKTAYAAATGLEVVMDHGWIATLAAPDDPSVQLSLVERDPTGPVNPAASIEVDDVEAAHEAAVAAGLEILYPLHDEDWGVRRFFFRDAGGNVVNVLSHR